MLTAAAVRYNPLRADTRKNKNSCVTLRRIISFFHFERFLFLQETISFLLLYLVCVMFYCTTLRACIHRILHASFRQILPSTALESLEIPAYYCGFPPCPRQNLLENPRTNPINTSSKIYSKLFDRDCKTMLIEHNILVRIFVCKAGIISNPHIPAIKRNCRE